MYIVHILEFYYSLLISILRITVGTLPKFEHGTYTISAQISAIQLTNHMISIYVYMKWTTFLTPLRHEVHSTW